MPLVNCPDCNSEVSSIAHECPTCARPNPGLDVNDLPTDDSKKISTETVVDTDTKEKKSKKRMPVWVKVMLFLTGLVGYFYYSASTSNTLRLVSLSSEDNLFSPAKVYAKFHNVGSDIKIKYWVTIGDSKEKKCEGTTFFSEGERRTLSFDCLAINNYTGTFYIRWTPY